MTSSLALFEAAIWVKIHISDKIMFGNQKMEINYGNKEYLYINLHRKDCLDRIHSLLRRADARGSADIDIIYHI